MANTVNPQADSGQGQSNTGTEPIDLGQSKYDFRWLTFPNTLGMDDNGHYMIININVPSDPGRTKALGNYTDKRYMDPITDPRYNASKVDRLRYGQTGIPRSSGNPAVAGASYLSSFFGVSLGGVKNAQGIPTTAALSIQRRTMRIAESIALHMPNPLVYNTHNAYEEISLSALGMKLGASGLTAITSAVTAAITGSTKAAQAAGGITSKIIGAGGQNIGVAAKMLQSPINPAVEILFSNTLVRQFTLEVMMAPRNEQESINMKEIIKTLRFHGAPEISDTGLFWIPPAEFDITFFNKGVENTNILRINTCVLERIEVDYSPTGVYSTFRNGHPVAARLSLGFRELEPVHKQRVLQGF